MRLPKSKPALSMFSYSSLEPRNCFTFCAIDKTLKFGLQADSNFRFSKNKTKQKLRFAITYVSHFPLNNRVFYFWFQKLENAALEPLWLEIFEFEAILTNVDSLICSESTFWSCSSLYTYIPYYLHEIVTLPLSRPYTKTFVTL
jgi:hypothetical protein